MKRSNNIDGFVLQRRSQNSDMSRQRPSLAGHRNVPERFLIDPAKSKTSEEPAGQLPAPMLQRTAGPAAITSGEKILPSPVRQKLDLDLSLDEPQQQEPKKKAKSGKQKVRKKWSRKKIVLSIVSLALVAILAFAGYFVYKFLSTGGKIFKGNVISALFDQGRPLKQDANGRSNILLFGTSEDDPGHPGADLTDSIMVVSVNQKTHDTFLVSIPRDLHVKYGKACVSGYEGKINVVYSCTKDAGGSEDDSGAALRSVMGNILGLDIQYSAHVNYTVLKEAVDAVGGITVNIQGDDPRGILDRNFDWMCNYKCYYVKYPNGPANLDGAHALALARARGDVAPTYGLSRSNPDREDNQRKILIALKDKAVTAGVLANPVAVNSLLDTLGNNLRTNFDANEIKTLIDIAKKTTNDNITSFSLEDSEHPLTTVTCFSGDICPNAGSFNYSAVQAAIKALSTGNKASLEYAKIDVLNASGVSGVAQTEADKLTAQSLTVSNVSTAPTSLGDKPLKLYDLSGGKKPATLKKLKELVGVDVTGTTLPAGVSSSADFIVIVGTAASSSTSTTNQ